MNPEMKESGTKIKEFIGKLDKVEIKIETVAAPAPAPAPAKTEQKTKDA